MPHSKNKKHKKKSTRKRYADDAETQELEEFESSSDEEITIIHENRKQRVKRAAKAVAQRVKEEPNCRSVLFRYCLFLIVLSLGVGMVVNLYGTYGEYVTDSIFPPRTSSAARVCVGGDPVIKNDYMVSYDHFDKQNETTGAGGWAFLNATQPTENLLMAWESEWVLSEKNSHSKDSPHMVDIVWAAKNVLKVWIPNPEKCVSFIVWSV